MLIPARFIKYSLLLAYFSYLLIGFKNSSLSSESGAITTITVRLQTSGM